MIEVATLQTLGGPDMSHATLSAPDMSVIGHHVWVGGQFQERRTNVLSSGVASLAPGVAPSAGQVAAWAPLLRRLTPQVVAQAGRPHCHLSGPAAQERVTTTSKRAHRPTRAQSGARAQNHGVNVQTLPTRRREQMPPPSIPTFPHQKAKKSHYQQHAVPYNPDMTAYCGLEELGLVAVGMRCGSSGVCRGLLRCPISHRCPISRRCPISHHCPTSVIS